MNRTHIFLGTAILALAAFPALAAPFDNNPDVAQGILNDLGRAYVGTSFPATRLELGGGDTYGWAVLDAQAGKVRTSAGHEKGSGDSYGSILNDL